MDGHRRRRFPWERSRSGGNGSSSEQPPEYVHPLDMPSDGDVPFWEGPAPDPFEAPQTTRLVPVGPARPARSRTDVSDSADDQEGQRPDDAVDAQAPVFAAETTREFEAPQPDERASLVSFGGGRPRFAPPDRRPALRPPASVADQRLGPTPRAGLLGPPAVARLSDEAGREQPAAANADQPAAANAAPPWVSTSRARPAAAAPTGPAGQPVQAEVAVRIEIVIIDQTGQVAPARPQGGADAPTPAILAPTPQVPKPAPEAPTPAPEVPAAAPTVRSSAPIRAAVRIVGVLALVGIGLFLVQIGVWLAR